jgi:hypothetical protein
VGMKRSWWGGEVVRLGGEREWRVRLVRRGGEERRVGDTCVGERRVGDNRVGERRDGDRRDGEDGVDVGFG